MYFLYYSIWTWKQSECTRWNNSQSELNLLVQNGYKEVVLTGVDITDYGKDLPRKT